MPLFTATDYEPVPPGLYTARLEKIEEAESVHGVYYRWVFLIEDDGFRGREVHANVSDKFGPQSKGRRWCEQMIGRPIRRGEQFDTDVLVGRTYHVMVSNTPEDERGRVYDNVDNVNLMRTTNGEAESGDPEKKPEEKEEDFDNIPW
jgi:hypothetical protein